MPYLCAVSRTVRLNTNTWSARLMGSPWRKLISICAAPFSWIRVSYLQLLGIRVLVHVLHEVLELGHRVDAVGQARRLPPARAALGRHQFVVRVGVLGHQVELHLRRHHRGQTLRGVEVEDMRSTERLDSGCSSPLGL